MIVCVLTKNGHADLISKQLPQTQNPLNLIHVIDNPILMWYLKMYTVTQIISLFF